MPRVLRSCFLACLLGGVAPTACTSPTALLVAHAEAADALACPSSKVETVGFGSAVGAHGCGRRVQYFCMQGSGFPTCVPTGTSETENGAEDDE